MSYMLCGLRVDSDLPLDNLPAWVGDDRLADVEIRLGSVPPIEAPIPRNKMMLAVGEGDLCRFEMPGIAAYRIEHGRRITIEPHVTASAPEVQLFLLGSAFVYLCHQRGLFPLHAGCVEIGGKAVAFAADSGTGKSTLIAAFVRAGYRMLGDDLTVVDMDAPGGPSVLPTFPRIKLWRGTLESLGISVDGLVPIRQGFDKYSWPTVTAFVDRPLPLAAVYRLERAPDARHAGITELRGGNAVGTLLASVHRRKAALRMRRGPALMKAALQMAHVQQAQLSVVSDIHSLSDVVARIAARHIS